MGSATLIVSLLTVQAVFDPLNDTYYPGEPNVPPAGTFPDLVRGWGHVNRGQGELRFEFEFATTVYPSDDYDHFDEMLFGYIDIDLDAESLPVPRGYSKKAELSGYGSGLDIEAYVDLGMMTNGLAPLLDSDMNWLADVEVEFDDTLVTVYVPLSSLPAPLGPSDKVAYAAYFYDAYQYAADVFPNGEGVEGQGYLITPEPTSVAFMASVFCGWLIRRPRRR